MLKYQLEIIRVYRNYISYIEYIIMKSELSYDQQTKYDKDFRKIDDIATDFKVQVKKMI